jgi:hypothetical protein
MVAHNPRQWRGLNGCAQSTTFRVSEWIGGVREPGCGANYIPRRYHVNLAHRLLEQAARNGIRMARAHETWRLDLARWRHPLCRMAVGASHTEDSRGHARPMACAKAAIDGNARCATANPEQPTVRAPDTGGPAKRDRSRANHRGRERRFHARHEGRQGMPGAGRTTRSGRGGITPPDPEQGKRKATVNKGDNQ